MLEVVVDSVPEVVLAAVPDVVPDVVSEDVLDMVLDSVPLVLLEVVLDGSRASKSIRPLSEPEQADAIAGGMQTQSTASAPRRAPVDQPMGEPGIYLG